MTIGLCLIIGATISILNKDEVLDVNKNTKKLLVVLLVCVALLIVAGAVLLGIGEKEPVIEDEPVIEVIEKEEPEVEYTDDYYREFYKSQKEINEDYVGQIFFKSGLIVQPFVQGKTNGTYLRTDWTNMKYDVEGSNFMDYANTIDDENIVIYGHYVFEYLDPTLTHKFSPLEQLLSKENYEDNKTIYLLLEDEIREYEIASVFYAQLVKDGEYYYTQDNQQYYLASFSDDYFETYHQAVKEVEQYKTGLDFTRNDKLLTLQTCTRSREDLREIVIAVEKNVYKLDGKCTFEKYDLTNSERNK